VKASDKVILIAYNTPRRDMEIIICERGKEKETLLAHEKISPEKSWRVEFNQDCFEEDGSRVWDVLEDGLTWQASDLNHGYEAFDIETGIRKVFDPESHKPFIFKDYSGDNFSPGEALVRALASRESQR
jgi:hypothetical protein